MTFSVVIEVADTVDAEFLPVLPRPSGQRIAARVAGHPERGAAFAPQVKLIILRKSRLS
ncbi:hypothetical protein [Quatrionicoccus australiensis]|uniref:hypothetical protein n=1 Tax=Quatrionicoccus australiensis TaxID=138118 RepID=UPI001CF918A8|nr:hypothetical protein [Quatrionicoccus australiensis]UCV13524.1 hypothetical protein KI612_11155 [Quatrionicoccus australiensis]